MAMVFGEVLKQWRRVRKYSQFELALAASVSQRHLSCLETGRSRPSRPMVMQLAEALDIPLRDRNELLSAAGFAALYKERGLDNDHMAAVRSALEQVLAKQEPYPCVVVDRLWNVIMANQSMQLLLDSAGSFDVPDHVRNNLALLTVHPSGLRPLIENFNEVYEPFMQRMRRDMMRFSDKESSAFFAQLLALVDDLPKYDADNDVVLLPTLPLQLKFGELTISLFSVISTFGTPQDVTTDEIRIESFYPSDDMTRTVLTSLVEASH